MDSDQTSRDKKDLLVKKLKDIIGSGARVQRTSSVGEFKINCNFKQGLRLAALSLIIISAAGAQTCAPISVPAVIVQGQTFQPAIVNGIDQVSTNSVRFQYTSTGTTNAVQIAYATAAQWAANGNTIIAGTAGVNYSLFQGTQGVNNIAAGSFLGNNITNLAPNTTYYIAGQASSNGGATWCPEVDESFTTLPWNGVQKPTSPNTFSVTEPVITGTDYTVGVGPCTTFAACVAVANPGDGIGIPPGTPVILPTGGGAPAFNSWKVPSAAIAVTPNYTTSTFSTTSVTGLSNGQQVHLGSTYYVPSPINPGVTYSLINVNASANTFQISQDGATPVTLNDNGNGALYVLPWPLTQSYVVIHSTASSANLPPPGVRLDPVAYGPYLGVIQMASPGETVLGFGFTAYYWLKDIEIMIAPNPTSATETDPTPSGQIFQTDPQTDHVVFDQCWLHPAPAPDRITLDAAKVGGTNIAILNSYIDNVESWRPTDTLPPSTVGTNTITINPGNYYSVSASNTNITCTISTPQTLTVSGTSGLSFYVSMPPGTCQLTVTAATGLTITGSGFTINYVASPGFPTDSNSNSTQLNIGSGTWYGTYIGWGDINGGGAGPAMPSRWVSETAAGVQLADGPGPFMFVNNTYIGDGIVGFFKDEFTGNGCSGVTACNYIYNTVDLTVQRNSIYWDPNYIITSPTWNGSWWFGRNGPEMKQGSRVLYDGNVVGPIYGGLGPGECLDLFTYVGSNSLTQVNVESTSDIEFRNNTCKNTGDGIQMSGGSINGLTPGRGMKRVWIHNNLFDNVNGYLQNPAPASANAHGFGIQFAAVQDLAIEHNTFAPNQAGDGSGSVIEQITQSGSLSVQNNIFGYDTESATPGFVFNTSGQNTPLPAPGNGAQGTSFLSYLNNVNLNNNVFLCTWSNDNPASLVEITGSACASASALYSATNWFPAGSALANRVSDVFWYSPGAYGIVGGNYRLKYQSPYFSSGSDHPTPGDFGDIGADINALEAAQGKVSNVHVSALTANTASITWLAPDSYACTLDYATSNFFNGSGSWTRVNSSATGPGGARVQTAALPSLPAGATITYRVNCAVMQPTGTFQTP